MRRREVIAMLGGAVAWPFGVFAQEAGRTYRIAYLGPAPRGIPAHLAFFEALSKLGFVEGKNQKSTKSTPGGSHDGLGNSCKPRRSS